MLHLRMQNLFRVILFVGLLVICTALPVQAGRSAQTVPTAGPPPTAISGETPNTDSPPPAPTAVLATSPVGGVQPTVTVTDRPTQTPPPGATLPPPTPTVVATATAASQASPTQASTAIKATLTSLPTLVSAAPAVEEQPGGPWCFPIGILLLVIVIWIIYRQARRKGEKQA